MKNRSYLLLHGLGGSGPENWQSWLYRELTQRQLDVHYPTFSNFDAPVKDLWLDELRAAIEQIPAENDVTVLTHSLGSILWMHYAATALTRRVDQVFLVAPPSSLRVLPEAPTFFPVPLNGQALAQAANETTFVLSTNDPYCSIDEVTPYLKLDAPALVFPKMGHINTLSGYGPWPWILDQCGADELR